jgi:hypothetical protein
MGAEAVDCDDARWSCVSSSKQVLQINVLDALRCFCWCLAEHLQADIIVSYGPDLVPRQPWHASFRARPTIASVWKQRLLKLLIDTIVATEEYRAESESEMDKK